jgi:uncharacterized protein (DUF2235 family)
MKNIFICTDGTWNRTLQTDRGRLALSNVSKLARVIRTTKTQLVYYDQGVGTKAGLDKWTGGAFGHGLFENVKQAYQFLVEHYVEKNKKDKDNILIFGFSRGAYTARSLAGLISEVGILRKKYVSDIDSIFKMYRKKEKYKNIIKNYTDNFCHPSRDILFLGVWDTVGSLGIPITWLNWLTRWKYKFHNTSLSLFIQNAYHAVALDEKRWPFKPTLWETKIIKKKQNIKQRWFPGVHCNIGGGYIDHGLSDLTFKWMIDQIKKCVKPLELDDTYILEQVKPDYCGELRESRTALYFLSRIIPYHRNPFRSHITNSKIDKSVHDRMQCKNCTYHPKQIKRKK